MLRMLEQTYRRSGAVSCGALLIALTLQTSGCTAIGLGIGSAIDARKPDRQEIPRSQWTHLEPDQEVLVEVADSTATERLRFVGVGQPGSDSLESVSTGGAGAYPTSVLFARSLARTRYLRQQLAGSTLEQDTLRIPATQINAIYRPVARSGKLYGLLIGLAVDLAILAALAPAFEGGFGLDGDWSGGL